MTDTREREDYESLLTHPGWQRHVLAITDFWAKRYEGEITKALEHPEDVIALGHLRQILAARKAVLETLNHPHERIATLTREQAIRERVPTVSRRGPL